MISAKRIKEIAKKAGADMCGVAPVERMKNAPPEMNPGLLWPNVKSIVGFVFRIPRGVQRGIEEGTQFYQYPSMAYGGINEIYAPSVLPYFTAGAATAMGLAWKAGVAAEVIAMSNLSIGYHLYRAKITLETPDLFAWTAMVVLLSVVLERLLRLVLQRGEGRKKDADHH